MPKVANQNPEARRTVGAALRRLRELRGLTQAELAARLGVNGSTVSVREAGTASSGISLDNLEPHLLALGSHLRMEFVDGPGEVEVRFAATLPPVLARLAEIWPQLDHRTQDMLAAAVDLADRTVGEIPGKLKKLG